MGARARRSEETAERIQGVALEKFLSGPYEDVTLAEIAAGAGVTVPTLIAHFGRKEDLFVASCEVWGYRMIESRDEAPVGDNAGAIRNLFDHYEEAGGFILHLLAEEDRFPAVREITDGGRKYHRLWVERVFEPSLGPLRGAAREQLLVPLIAAADVYTWKQLRRDMKLPRRQAEAAILRIVDALTADS
jgi:AcrR family transcriptional regulator